MSPYINGDISVPQSSVSPASGCDDALGWLLEGPELEVKTKKYPPYDFCDERQERKGNVATLGPKTGKSQSRF